MKEITPKQLKELFPKLTTLELSDFIIYIRNELFDRGWDYCDCGAYLKPRLK